MRNVFEKVGASPRKNKAGSGWPRWAAAAALALGAVLGMSGCAGTGVRNTSRSFRTVVIDAGHGGHDAGTRSSRLMLEKDAALDVALRLNTKMRAAGFKTVLTRKNDTFIPLDQRAAISNRQGNAVFVSVHFNEARPRPDISGAETYYHSAPSAELARRLLGKVGALPGSRARFAHVARFRVLRLNRNPAVLVECGYMSNRGEAARAATPAYRDAIAGAIAAGLIEQRR